MKLRYGSNYFTYIISFMFHESWRLLLFNSQIRNLRHRLLKNLAWAHTAVAGRSKLWTYTAWVRSPQAAPYAASCYGTGEHECEAEGKGLHAAVLTGQLTSGSARGSCSAPCLALVSWNIPTSNSWSPRCTPEPHLDIEVVHSFCGHW